MFTLRNNKIMILQIEQGSRQICSEHFVSLITNWEKSDVRSRNNRQSRVTSETRIVKCPLTHQKPVNAEIRRVVNKVKLVFD